jgi:hypothetical protein
MNNVENVLFTNALAYYGKACSEPQKKFYKKNSEVKKVRGEAKVFLHLPPVSVETKFLQFILFFIFF